MTPILQTIVARGQLDAMLEDSMVLYREILADIEQVSKKPPTPPVMRYLVTLQTMRMDVEEIAAEYINERISLIGVI